jgi:hypothetical protein
MKSLIASSQEIVLELTEDQSRQIERATGKLVTELQVEIVEASESLDGPRAELPTPNYKNSIKEGETLMNPTASFTNHRNHVHNQLNQGEKTTKAKRILLPLIAIVLLAVSSASVYAQNAESAGADGKNEKRAQSGQFGILGQNKGALKGTFIGKAIADGPVPYIFTQTFHEDGTCESNASLELVPPAASTAHGQWQYLGGDQFASTTVGTLVNSVIDPTLFGTFKVRQLLTFNRQRDQIINQRIQVDVFDVDGNLVFSFGATPDGPARLVTVEVLQ